MLFVFSDTGGVPIQAFVLEIDQGNGYEEIYRGQESECTVDRLSPGQSYGKHPRKLTVTVDFTGVLLKWMERKQTLSFSIQHYERLPLDPVVEATQVNPVVSKVSFETMTFTWLNESFLIG